MLFLSSLWPCLMFSDPSSSSLIPLRVLNRHGLRVQRPTAAVRKRGELGGMFVSAGDRCCFIHICFVTVNREPLLSLNWHPEREPPSGALLLHNQRGLEPRPCQQQCHSNWIFAADDAAQFAFSVVSHRHSASKVGLQASFSASVAFPGSKKKKKS